MIVSVCRLGDERTEPVIELLRQAGLPEAECRRLGEIRNEAARRASVRARVALLWALLAHEEGVTLHEVGTFPAVKGQPLAGFSRLETGRCLLADRDLGISLAHSDQLAVCAVSRRGSVGVDVEPLARRIAHAEDIGARCFSDGERALLAAANDRDAAFLRIWTRKEALGKALGTGLAAKGTALDTTAYPDDCFFEWVIEESLVAAVVLK